jgi:hypothetical protein
MDRKIECYSLLFAEEIFQFSSVLLLKKANTVVVLISFPLSLWLSQASIHLDTFILKGFFNSVFYCFVDLKCFITLFINPLYLFILSIL